MKVQGIQEGKTTAELAKGAKGYLKEIDALAKITGVERSAKEAEMAAAAADAQFQGAMAGKSAEVRQSFLDTLGGLAGGMQGPLGAFAKDILATGTATTEENQRLMSMMGESASYLNMLRGKMQKGEAVSAAERNTLNNLMAKEGTAAAKQMGGAFATLPEFAPTMNAITLASGMQQNALKQSTAEQQKAAEETDKMNESISKMKEALAALTNKITMMLANSGGLGLLMAVFEKLANFVITVVLPGIGILIPILEKIFNGVVMLMQPVIESVTKAFGGLSGPLAAVDNILNFLFDTLNGVVRGGILIFESALKAFDTLAGPFNRLSAAIFGTEESAGGFSNTLIRIGDAVGQALEILAQVIGFVIDYAIVPLTNFIAQHLVPVFQQVWNVINDYLVPILVAAGVAFLAFNAMTMAATVVTFAQTTAMALLTAGSALLTAGMAIVTGGFALLGLPLTATIAVLGVLLIAFKKFGGDMEVAGNGFKWLWSYIEELGQNLVKFYYYLMDKVTVGSEYKDKMAEQNKKIETTQADRAKLETAMTEKMAANRLKREEEEKNAGKGGLMGLFGGMNDDRAEQHIEAKKLQTAQFKSQIPQALAGSVGPAVGNAVKDELSKSDTKTDYNAGPEGLLKQFGTREGSALAGAESSRQGMVAEAEKKKQDEASKQQDEVSKKKEEEEKNKKKEEEEKNKKPESAESLLAQLNTNMIKLLAHAEQTTKNTYATYDAAKGLNKNLYKA